MLLQQSTYALRKAGTHSMSMCRIAPRCHAGSFFCLEGGIQETPQQSGVECGRKTSQQ